MVSDPSLLYHADFADLPYFTMEETDPDGTSYKWDFIYGNIGGKYPLYSHLSVHRSDVLFPLATDFDLAVTNTTTYMTYTNRSDEHLYVISLPIIETIATGVYDRFTGALLYVVYQKNDLYVAESGIYDISDPVVAASINENNLFITGDNVRVSLPGASKLDTVFVKRGDILDVADVGAVLVPFEESVVDAAQEITMQLADTTLVSTTFNAGSGTVTLLGNTYSSGQYFILGGKKVTVKTLNVTYSGGIRFPVIP